VLQALQSQLAEFYEIEPPCPVEPFLVTEKAVVQAIDPEAVKDNAREQLIGAEHSGELNLSLYVEGRILDQLDQLDGAPPTPGQLDALWLAVEGVSHFLHLTWRACRDRPISQLELELQAEIDKYLYTRAWLRENRHTDYLPALHTLLFDLTRSHEDLDAAETTRYATANRYAAKYCLDLHRRADRELPAGDLKALRRFYRLSQYEKLRYIDALS
jgi:hypothetical protein